MSSFNIKNRNNIMLSRLDQDIVWESKLNLSELQQMAI